MFALIRIQDKGEFAFSLKAWRKTTSQWFSSSKQKFKKDILYFTLIDFLKSGIKLCDKHIQTSIFLNTFGYKGGTELWFKHKLFSFFSYLPALDS